MAQQAASQYSRQPASSLEQQLNARGLLHHANVQPASGQGFLQVADSCLKARNETANFCFGPLINVGGGGQVQRKTGVVSGGFAGMHADWHWKSRWAGTLGYTLNAAIPPNYISHFADSLGILHGVGYARGAGKFYHAHYGYGHVSYSAKKFFQFEAGRRKHFWGDGYRSLVLSDASNAFPYLRITTKFWHIQYTNLWAQMRDFSFSQIPREARKKYVAMHCLSWNINKQWNWSLYEMAVWQDRDTNSRRTLEINYLNPIIFYRPVEYSQGSPDNMILATSLRFKASPRVQLYSQIVVDEFYLSKWRNNSRWWANKVGGQVGIKIFDAFTNGLHLQSEWNCVRPFTYSHGSPIQSWTNMNQPLAHPMGANFAEWLFFLRYTNEKWEFSEQFIWAAYGRDRDVDGNGTVDNLGGDIFRSYRNPFRQYDNDLMQGLKSTFHFNEITLARKLGVGEFELFTTHTMRFEKNEKASSFDHFFIIGIRTSGLLKPLIDY